MFFLDALEMGQNLVCLDKKLFFFKVSNFTNILHKFKINEWDFYSIILASLKWALCGKDESSEILAHISEY